MTTTTLPTFFPNAQVLTQVNCGHHQILGARLTLKYFDNLCRCSSHQTIHQPLVVSLGRDASDPDSDPRKMEIVGSTSNCKVYLRHCHRHNMSSSNHIKSYQEPPVFPKLRTGMIAADTGKKVFSSFFVSPVSNLISCIYLM